MLKDIIKQQKDINKSFKEKSNEKENKNVDNLDIKKNLFMIKIFEFK